MQAWPSTVLHKASSVYLSKPAKQEREKSEEIPEAILWISILFFGLTRICASFVMRFLEERFCLNLKWFPRLAPPEPVPNANANDNDNPKWQHAQPTIRTMLVRLLTASQSMVAGTQMALALAAVKRILQEARELANDSSTDYHAAPLEVFPSS